MNEQETSRESDREVTGSGRNARGNPAAERSNSDSIYLERLDRLLRTAERVRSLAEKIEAGIMPPENGSGAPLPEGAAGRGRRWSELSSDAEELRGLAGDLMLLGYTFREVRLEASFRYLAAWTERTPAGAGRGGRLEVNAEGLQIDHRLAPVLRERLQELILLMLEMAGLRPDGELVLHLEAGVEGRSLRVRLGGEGLGLDAAEVKRCARQGGLAEEAVEAFRRQPGRLVFHPAFAAGWGLPANWSARLQGLRGQLRQRRGELEVREAAPGGMVFSLRLPLLADLASLLIVGCGGRKYAIPIEAVFSTRVVGPEEWRRRDGGIWLETPLPLPGGELNLPNLPVPGPAPGARLEGLLGIGESGAPLSGEVPESSRPVVLVEDEQGLGALLVDEVIGERQLLLRHPGRLLRRVRHLMASVLLPGDELCMVVHPWDLLRTLRAGSADPVM